MCNSCWTSVLQKHGAPTREYIRYSPACLLAYDILSFFQPSRAEDPKHTPQSIWRCKQQVLKATLHCLNQKGRHGNPFSSPMSPAMSLEHWDVMEWQMQAHLTCKVENSHSARTNAEIKGMAEAKEFGPRQIMIVINGRLQDMARD